MKTKEEMKNWIIVILIGIGSFFLVNNLQVVGNVFKKLIDVLYPFILGGIFAFILNIPMTRIEKFLNKKIKKPKVSNRLIAIIISLLLLISIVLVIAFLVIPELVNNIEGLISSIPTVIESLENWVIKLLDKVPEIQSKIQESFANNANVDTVIINTLNYILNGSLSFASSLISGIITFFTGIVFAVYMLSQKEHIISNVNKILKASVKDNIYHEVTDIGTIANRSFSKFISGQCLEACILGTIFFIVLTIGGFPYALIISLLTGVTALIPYFGALIAMVIGALLIAITNPVQALIFVVIFQIIQQIENNIIYPRVVGASVGLSPIWTLLAISVGGSLFGIVGMMVAIPIASVIYSYLKNKIKIT